MNQLIVLVSGCVILPVLEYDGYVVVVDVGCGGDSAGITAVVVTTTTSWRTPRAFWSSIFSVVVVGGS